MCLSFCHSFCKQDNWRTQKRTSTKFGRQVIDFWWWSRSACGFRITFLHHCKIGDFWTFVGISHTTNGRLVPYSAKRLMLTRSCILNILGQIRRTYGADSGLIWKSGFESWVTFVSMYDIGRGLCCLSALVFL